MTAEAAPADTAGPEVPAADTAGPEAPAADTAPPDTEERWALVDRRDFLRRSLEDADREHEAGDLEDADYVLLRRRDEASLADVEAQLAALDSRPAPDPVVPVGARRVPPGVRRRVRRPRRRAWLGVVGTLAVIAGVVVLVVNLTSTRLPGQVLTGGVTLTGAKLIDQELDQAAVLDDQGNAVTAIRIYQLVLSKDPRQGTALAELGWLEWESGSSSGNAALESTGRASVAKAVEVAPSFYAGHLYLGTIDVDQGDAEAAVAQYRLFLADQPPSSWVRDFSPEIRDAFAADGEKVPAGVAAGSAPSPNIGRSTSPPST